MNEKIKVPDGRGGWQETTLREPRKKVTSDAQKKEAALQKAQEEDYFERVGSCTVALNQFLEIYARDHGLDKEEVIGALYLEVLNNLEFYPKKEGGRKKVERICADVNAYFQENKGGVPTP